MLFQNKKENFRKTKRRAKRLSKIFFFTNKWEIRDTNELAEKALV
jgi:hypothetical protein